MYMMGSRLVANHPISTLTPGNNLNVTVLSHNNSLDFGLLAAHGTLPDIELLVERMNHQFEALAQEFGVATGAGRKRPARAGAKPRPKAKGKARPKAGAGGGRTRKSPAASETAAGE
jgi:hypothetical protein